MIGHYKHIHLIGIHGFDALIWQEKLFIPPFYLESKFIPQIGDIWNLIIISTLLTVEHYKHILVLGIQFLCFGFQEKLFFPTFP